MTTLNFRGTSSFSKIAVFACTLIISSYGIGQTTNDDLLQESVNASDLVVNDYLISELEPIRENFKRITSINSWEQVIEVELTASTEGGFARIYKGNDGMEKLVVRHFGEMFQSITEYFILDYELSFVLERALEYNRPIYYDSMAMVEMGDSEFFDPKKANLEEHRSYFLNGELAHQLYNKDCGNPFDALYIDEENTRIWSAFVELWETIDQNMNHDDRTMIGVWQGIPVLGSGWSATYQFFEDGSFRFNHNQMDCSDSVLYEAGTYSISDDSITLNYATRSYLAGGTLEPSTGSCGSAFELVGGIETEEQYLAKEQLQLQYLSPLLDVNYLERVKLDGMEWFRMLHDPNDY